MKRLPWTVWESSKWNEFWKWFAYATVRASAIAAQPARNRLGAPELVRRAPRAMIPSALRITIFAAVDRRGGAAAPRRKGGGGGGGGPQPSAFGGPPPPRPG